MHWINAVDTIGYKNAVKNAVIASYFLNFYIFQFISTSKNKSTYTSKYLSIIS